MEQVDYLKLAEQYTNFLVAVGGVSITVIALILNLGSRSADDKPPSDKEINSRVFLIAALIVATVSCFTGAHMMAETAAFVSYHKEKSNDSHNRKLLSAVQLKAPVESAAQIPVEPETKVTGERLFLLASTNIFVAALLVVFAIMLLPTASGEKNASLITPISKCVFWLMTFGIALWLALASVYRMGARYSLFAIPFAGVFGGIYFYYFKGEEEKPPSHSFIPIVIATVLLICVFSITFDSSDRATVYDIFLFSITVFITVASLCAAGLRMKRWPDTPEKTAETTPEPVAETGRAVG